MVHTASIRFHYGFYILKHSCGLFSDISGNQLTTLRIKGICPDTNIRLLLFIACEYGPTATGA